MHYKNGREAKVGDKILFQPQGGVPFIGILVEVTPGSTTCNGRVIPLPANSYVITMSDCAHVDDIAVTTLQPPAAPESAKEAAA